VTGEEVSYTYDSLQRLTAAATTGSGGWGTAYGYDGFGNLWSKTQTKGNPPQLSVTYDRTTNRQDGVSYDANGNPATINGIGVGWDEENRLAYQSGYWGQDYWGYHGLPAPPAEWEYDP
jgi:YD repeat-containing protein